MNWEITWKAAEFSPNYIYNIDEYCNQHTDPTLDKSVNCAMKPYRSVTDHDNIILITVINLVSVYLQKYFFCSN